MDEVFEVGIRIALDNGVAQAAPAIARDLAMLDRAVAATEGRLTALRAPAAPSVVRQVARAAEPVVEPVTPAPMPRPVAPPPMAPAAPPAGPVPADPPASAPVVISPPALPAPAPAAAPAPAQPAPLPTLPVVVPPPAPVAAPIVMAPPVAPVPVAVPMPRAVPGAVEVGARQAPEVVPSGPAAPPPPRPPAPVRFDLTGPALERFAPMAAPVTVQAVPPRPLLASLPTAATPEAIEAPAPPAWPAAAPPGVPVAAPAPAAQAQAGDAVRATAPSAPEPESELVTEGRLEIDGALLGRWIAQHLGREAGRPQSGVTAVDSRVSIPWAGALQG